MKRRDRHFKIRTVLDMLEVFYHEKNAQQGDVHKNQYVPYSIMFKGQIFPTPFS